ncbi:MAG: hypothetical protein IT210_19375 [Armatimonadetes bacterium]|nr:hypothetical protein [Armatimonadota bacterium]
MPVIADIDTADGMARLERLRSRRLAEDERLVCLARIIHEREFDLDSHNGVCTF